MEPAEKKRERRDGEMKKNLFIFLVAITLTGFSSSVYGNETLLDNNLELKTERLNKMQTDDGKSQNFVVDDRLFNTEQQAKLAKAEENKAQQQKVQTQELFTKKVPLLKNDLNKKQLFSAQENNKELATQREETATAVSSPPSFFPLILGALLVTGVTLILYTYNSRKRGQQDGRK